MTNSQLQPLAAPTVPLELINQSGGKVQTVTLRPDASRAGMYSGQFTAVQQGRYHLELLIPESDNERLTREIEVRLPQLEQENIQRNDALLARLAEETGGEYYRELDAAMNPSSRDPLVPKLKDRTKTSILTRGAKSRVARNVHEMGDVQPLQRVVLRMAHTAAVEARLRRPAMTGVPPSSLAPAIQTILAHLRQRIRRYVCIEGLAAASVWLAAAFWMSLAIDWAFEPSRSVRHDPALGRSRHLHLDRFPLDPRADLGPALRPDDGDSAGAIFSTVW